VVDEIVVVDQESSDSTVEICGEYTKNIYFTRPKGFPEPDRNFGFSKATGEWIISLDADETLSPNLQSHMARLIEGSCDIYSFPIVNYYFGRPLHHGLMRPAPHIRMFRKGKIYCPPIMHASPIVSGEVRSVPWPIVHKPKHGKLFLSPMEKVVRYGRLVARQRTLLHPRALYFFYAVNVFVRKFYQCFFLRKGYRDGIFGLLISYQSALSFWFETVFMALYSPRGGQA
jgi:glycosyltransferase involved in cell wall biosynthesis